MRKVLGYLNSLIPKYFLWADYTEIQSSVYNNLIIKRYHNKVLKTGDNLNICSAHAYCRNFFNDL